MITNAKTGIILNAKLIYAIQIFLVGILKAGM